MEEKVYSWELLRWSLIMCNKFGPKSLFTQNCKEIVPLEAMESFLRFQWDGQYWIIGGICAVHYIEESPNIVKVLNKSGLVRVDQSGEYFTELGSYDFTNPTVDYTGLQCITGHPNLSWHNSHTYIRCDVIYFLLQTVVLSAPTGLHGPLLGLISHSPYPQEREKIKILCSMWTEIFSFQGRTEPLGECKQLSGNSFYANVLVHCQQLITLP